MHVNFHHLFGREQAQWEERVAKHVAYKEKFEVEAEEAHLPSTWFTKVEVKEVYLLPHQIFSPTNFTIFF